jgi:asparaginyl-tRNA synthetase
MNWLAVLGSPAKSEHVRFLTEKHAKKPVIVMNYPKAIKAFLHASLRRRPGGRPLPNPPPLAAAGGGGRGGGLPRPGIDEIIGGSQHEERLEVLDRSMAERGIDREHYAPHPSLPRSRPRAGEG